MSRFPFVGEIEILKVWSFLKYQSRGMQTRSADQYCALCFSQNLGFVRLWLHFWRGNRLRFVRCSTEVIRIRLAKFGQNTAAKKPSSCVRAKFSFICSDYSVEETQMWVDWSEIRGGKKHATAIHVFSCMKWHDMCFQSRNTFALCWVLTEKHAFSIMGRVRSLLHPNGKTGFFVSFVTHCLLAWVLRSKREGLMKKTLARDSVTWCQLAINFKGSVQRALAKKYKIYKYECNATGRMPWNFRPLTGALCQKQNRRAQPVLKNVGAWRRKENEIREQFFQTQGNLKFC